MHPTEGQLQAYTDHSLPPAETERITAHLACCPHCQAQAQGMAERTRQMQMRLASLNPQPKESAPSINIARYRLQNKLNQKESQTMFNKLFNSRMRPVWGALAVILVLTVAFSFPQVRVAANSFLGQFRVQQVTVLPVDEEVFSGRMMQFNNDNGTMLKAMFEDASEEVIGESLASATAEEAAVAAGIAVRLPEGVNLENISVEQGSRVTFTVDQPMMQAVFDETGLDIEIPQALDGATVTGEIRPVVFTSFNCTTETVNRRSDPDDPDAGGAPVEIEVCTNLLQTASPTINAPAGLDLATLGEGYLQLMGMSAEEAHEYSQNVDWATTLVIPVPPSGSYENVPVDGVEGVLMRQNTYVEDAYYILVWSKDGVVYALTGTGSNTDALALANSLK